MSKLDKLRAINNTPALQQVEAVEINFEIEKEKSKKDTKEKNVKEQEVTEAPIVPEEIDKTNEVPEDISEKEPVKLVALSLLQPLNRYVRVKSKKARMTMDLYITQLVKKEMERFSKGEAVTDAALFDLCYRKFAGAKEKTSARIPVSYADFLIDVSSNAGITMTDYYNYLISKEMAEDIEYK